MTPNNHPIPSKYHPQKAIRKEELELFNIYHFRDGTKLVVRRMFEAKLFKRWWQLFKPKPHLERELGYWTPPRAHLYKIGKTDIVVRKPPQQTYENGKFDLNGMLNCYSKAFTARVRMESPIALLIHSQGYLLIHIVKYKSGFNALPTSLSKEPIQTIIEKTAYELGKLHGAGVQHGHPHADNIVADKNGNIYLIDSKIIQTTTKSPLARNFSEPFSQEDLDALLKEKSEGTSEDLKWLASAIYAMNYIRHSVSLPSVIESYKRGLQQGKKRIAEWEKKQAVDKVT